MNMSPEKRRWSRLGVNVEAKDIKDTIKDIPFRPIMILVTIISALLIFLPDSILKKLFLYEFRNKVGVFLGIIFLLSLCITVYLFVEPAIKRQIINKKLSGKSARRIIDNLSLEEKQIVLYMYAYQSETVVMPSANTSVSHLRSIMIISYGSTIGGQIGTVQLFPFILQPWAIKGIEDNWDLFESIPKELPYEIAKYIDFAKI